MSVRRWMIIVIEKVKEWFHECTMYNVFKSDPLNSIRHLHDIRDVGFENIE